MEAPAPVLVLLDTGVRIGEALGLRHEDVEIADRHVTVTPRDNDNRARAKGGRTRVIPASAELMRLYADYLHGIRALLPPTMDLPPPAG